MTRLAVEELAVEYPGARGRGVRVVDGLSLTLPAGRALALVGESGCGKTSTLLALAGLLPHGARVAAGRVLLDGMDLLGLDERARARARGERVALVFQEAGTALHPLARIDDQVGEPLRIHRGASRSEARAAAVSLLALVGIADPEAIGAGYAHQLSGGMQKRALLAMALALRPPLLLADEPTAALDATVAAAVLDLLDHERRTRGMALLLVTHDLAVAATRCDDIAVMYAGRVVEQGPAAEVVRRPAHPYTVALRAALPRLEDDARGPLRDLPGAVPPAEAWAGAGCRFRGRCEAAFERCWIEEPALLPRDGGRAVRCHLPVAAGDGA